MTTSSPLRPVAAGVACLFAGLTALAQPRLAVLIDEGQSIRLSWEDPGGGFALESSSALGPGASWQAVDVTPVVEGTSRRVNLGVTAQTGYFRLRGPASSAPLTIVESSPAAGEGGVAVTRETVFRFSGPLAADTTVTRDHLYAEFAGRALLTRVEISADRRSASLFYLENLPGRARIRVSLVGDGIRGANGADVDADGDGTPGGVRRLEFDTSAVLGVPGTAVMGHVYAAEPGPNAEDVPLANVIITVDGAEETLRTTTDETGFFRLQPTPTGRFFVHVDGRTAQGSQWPAGAYYPLVGKAWESIPGVTNNLASGTGEIFLPLVPADALQPVSALEETRIAFSPAVVAENPALAGVEVRVPPNALFHEDGTRGGRVGIAAVPPDRLPEPLPPGLQDMPLVITIQTDGPLNFDQPVPVRFPNLPDPATGVRLPPGAKTVLWSFNHDTGHWEAQGTATVSADGLYADTDAGVGVRQPGWHGVRPDTPPGGPDENDPDNDEDDYDDDNNNDKHDDDCHKIVICQAPGVPKSGGHCILECSEDAISDLLCRLNPFCDEDEATKPERSPVELGLCAGNAIICQGQEQSVQGVFETDRYDDMLIQRDKDCMDECMHPPSTPFPLVVPCDVFDPCPDLLPFGPVALGAARGRVLAQPPLTPEELAASIPLDWLREQRALWNVEGDYYSLVLGNARILETAPAELKHWRRFFRAAKAASGSATEAGSRFSPAEKAALVALPRASQMSEAEMVALVDRLDLLLGNAVPAAQWDAAAIQAAAERVVAVRQELLNRGWQYRLDGLIRGLLLASQELSVVPGSPEFPVRAHYYRLVNLANGFEIRGRLSPQGRLENIALAPNAIYSVGYLDPETGRVAAALFETGAVGVRTVVPTAPFEAGPDTDTDGDGLTDLAETIVGTFPDQFDSDGDGEGDGDEVRAGGNPLDGVARPLGVVASASGGGETHDLAVQAEVAVTIGTGVGLTWYDVSQPETPVLLNRFVGAGDFDAMAVDWPLVLVVSRGRTALLYSISQAAQPPELRWQMEVTSLRGVTMGHGYAYLGGSTLKVVELETGTLVHEVATAGYGQLRVAGGHLWGLRQTGSLWSMDTYALQEGGRSLALRGQVEVPGRLAPQERALPFFVAEGRAYVGTFTGYVSFDVTDPADLILVGGGGVLTAANHAVAPDGSGLLATTTSFAGPDTLRVSLYSDADPRVTTNLVISFDTPGDPRKLTPYQGRLYIADSQAGLSVANYRPLDRGAIPPAVGLVAYPRTQAGGLGVHESGQLLRVEARATDDVAVSQVEFFLDDEFRARAGSYPFAADLRAPALTATKTVFSLRARAWDTAGHSSWSEVIFLGLTNELRRPYLVSHSPVAGLRQLTNSLVEIHATFNEPMDLASLQTGWILIAAGADDRFGTADDTPLTSEPVMMGGNAYALMTPQPLPVGLYQVTATTNVTDVFGNRLLTPAVWDFGIRPLLTLAGSGALWSADSRTATNWSSGAIPTRNDILDLSLPGGVTIASRCDVEAYSLIARNPMHFDGIIRQGCDSQLMLVGRGVFERAVLMEGQATWLGGESDILESLTIAGPNNAALYEHRLYNHGQVVLDKGPSTGLLLRNQGSEPVGIWNRPGAVFEHIGGGLVVGTGLGPCVFVNEGLYLKTGPEEGRVRLSRFQNLAEVEVREGTLEFQGDTAAFGGEEHLGSYRVHAGARLNLLSRFSSFGRSTRMDGGGSLELVGGTESTLFPGRVEVQGGVRLRSGRMRFSGLIASAGGWALAGTAQFAGLAQRLQGPMVIERNGALIVEPGSPLALDSLLSSNQVVVNTALRVEGPAEFQGGSLAGSGRLTLAGSTTFAGTVGSVGTAATGVLEIGGAATCAPAALVRPVNFQLRILSAGSFELGEATEVRFGGVSILNDGLVEKSLPGLTRTVNGLENRGTLRVRDGGLSFEGGPLLQMQGLISLSTTGLVVHASSNRGANGIVDLRGGRFEGGPQVYCGRFTNAAVVAPGLPIGLLDLRVGTHPTLSVYHQTGSGRLEIEIAGSEPGLSHDQLQVTGRAVLGGTLQLVPAPAYDPPLGAELTILTAQRIEGEFAEVLGNGLPGGKRFEPDYSLTDVTLRVVTGP
ncbi:MAG: Ig-like domain-containing protein [Verrucomicrobiales bacterium]|nr:Ig-like domain-containing protein [Verrucomicrobiales bacterium]